MATGKSIYFLQNYDYIARYIDRIEPQLMTWKGSTLKNTSTFSWRCVPRMYRTSPNSSACLMSEMTGKALKLFQHGVLTIVKSALQTIWEFKVTSLVSSHIHWPLLYVGFVFQHDETAPLWRPIFIRPISGLINEILQ